MFSFDSLREIYYDPRNHPNHHRIHPSPMDGLASLIFGGFTMNYLTLRDVEELKPSELIEKIILAEIISYKLSHCSETFKAETEHNGVMCKLELDKRLNSL